jgi:tRNA(Ile)-lysidine synthetase-like protein
VAYRAGDRLEFGPGGAPAGADFTERLAVPGAVTTPSGVRVTSGLRPAGGARAAATTADAAAGSEGSFAVEFDWSVIRGPIEVRSRRPGDRIAPRGMSGRKSIQDLLVDRKVAWPARRDVPVVADGERILWVVGHAVSREAPVTPATERALVLSLEPSASPGVNR